MVVTSDCAEDASCVMQLCDFGVLGSLVFVTLTSWLLSQAVTVVVPTCNLPDASDDLFAHDIGRIRW